MIRERWVWAALGVMMSLIPCGITCFRGNAQCRLVGLEMASTIVTLTMVCLAEGFGRPMLFDLPLTLALFSFGGGLVFARFLERWI
jgi:multicomponent Na+:H+ antiporter subunit F